MKRRFFSIICLLFSILFYSCSTDTEVPVYHTVSFDSNGGSFITAQTIEHGKKVIEPDEPVREGYLFMGWYNGEEKYFFTTLVTSDLVLTAEWKVAINYYNIGFLSNLYYIIGPTLLHFIFPLPKYNNYILYYACLNYHI